MTTLELIDFAREYAEEYGHDSEGGITIPFPRDKLLELADRLEMTYQDIDISCSTCIHYPCNHRGDCFNNEYKGYQWRGDEE